MNSDPTPIQVRPARHTDHPAIVELSRRVFAPYGPYGVVVPGWLVREDVEALVAERGGAFCGAVVLARAVRDDQPIAELLAVGVIEGQRRRGVGTALLFAALERIRGWSGVPSRAVWLHTAADNHGARALFARFGFLDADDVLGCYEGGQPILAMIRPLIPCEGATPDRSPT